MDRRNRSQAVKRAQGHQSQNDYSLPRLALFNFDKTDGLKSSFRPTGARESRSAAVKERQVIVKTGKIHY
jgi:hypothetical protein